MAAGDVYGSSRMAAGYAFSRPPVHPLIIRRVRNYLGLDQPVARALDIGCGAGRSTAALEPLARHVVGLEPVRGMLIHRRAVAPRASFVVATAERLPFVDGSFDVVTAAGALNYVDPPAFFREFARVTTPRGLLIIYDFSPGRRLPNDRRLDDWYAAFEDRYPPRPGYDMDVRALHYRSAGLELDGFEAFEVAVPMTLSSYVAYAMSETGVELAVARRASEAGIRSWCESTLAGILSDEPRDVLFDAYVACVRKRSPAASSSSSSLA